MAGFCYGILWPEKADVNTGAQSDIGPKKEHNGCSFRNAGARETWQTIEEDVGWVLYDVCYPKIQISETFISFICATSDLNP